MESAGILAGPMLRRVNTDSVAILVATDRPVEVDAAIYKLDTFPLETATKTTSVRAGHRLFIHPLRVHGQTPTDSVLGYDLFFRVGTIMYDMASFGLIHKTKIPSRLMDCPTLRFSSPLTQLQTSAS